MTDDIILQTKALSKQFKGFVAVDDVNLEVRRGTIHGLIGPNGAGKTTVFNLLTRFLKPSGGRILSRGAISPARNPPTWRAAGWSVRSRFPRPSPT